MSPVLIFPQIKPALELVEEGPRSKLAALFDQLVAHVKHQEKLITEQEKRILILEEHRRLEALARFAARADRIASLSPDLRGVLNFEPGLNEAELDAVLDQPAAQTEAEAPALASLLRQKRYKTKLHPGRAAFPAWLPRVPILIDLVPAPLADGTLAKELRRDMTERLNVNPASYFVESITTVSYSFPQRPGAGVHRGPAPAALNLKSGLAPALVIEFLVHKYADHSPLYRQVLALERDHGIFLSYPTVDRQVIDAAALAIPLADALLAELLATCYIQADETRIPVLDPSVKGKAATAYLWTYSNPRGGVVYRVHPGRGGTYILKDLANFSGRIQSDGYQVYQTLAKLFGERVTHYACLAHVRRKFTDIVRANQNHAASSAIVASATRLVSLINALYEIERSLKSQNADHPTRQQERAARSLPLFDAFIRGLERVCQDPDLLPGGALARACRYALNLQVQLRRTLENGETEIDNNLVYAARGITAVMPPPDLCRVHKLEAHFPHVCHSHHFPHAA